MKILSISQVYLRQQPVKGIRLLINIKKDINNSKQLLAKNFPLVLYNLNKNLASIIVQICKLEDQELNRIKK